MCNFNADYLTDVVEILLHDVKFNGTHVIKTSQPVVVHEPSHSTSAGNTVYKSNYTKYATGSTAGLSKGKLKASEQTHAASFNFTGGTLLSAI